MLDSVDKLKILDSTPSEELKPEEMNVNSDIDDDAVVESSVEIPDIDDILCLEVSLYDVRGPLVYMLDSLL